MRITSRKIAVVAVAAVCAAVPTWAAATSGTPAHTNGVRHGHHGAHLVPAAVFLPKAAMGNRFEIVTGQLAQQRAESSAVKELGAMFVTDHTAALAQVTQVAQQLGVTLPDGLSPRQQAVVERLQSLSGAEFDAAWVKAQLIAHHKALFLHLRTAIRGENDAIRTLAQNALPVITKHLGELIDLVADGDHGDSMR